MASGFAVVVSLVLLPQSSFAATFQAGERIVRREPEAPQRVSLSPHGEMLRDRKELDNTHLTAQEKAMLGAQFCNYDFPLGEPGTSKCKPADSKFGNASLILEESMCIQAGIESGAKTDHDTFKIGQEWEQKRPKGCFAKACKENSGGNGMCYFYNGNGAEPTELTKKEQGTPVCSRAKYIDGKKDTNGECPDKAYKMIQHQELCGFAANCESFAPAKEFRIGVHNASEHANAPSVGDGGCFHDDDNVDGEGKRKVYYNQKSPITPSNPKGVPICVIEKKLTWKAGGKEFEQMVDVADAGEHKGTGSSGATKADAPAAAPKADAPAAAPKADTPAAAPKADAPAAAL